MVNSAKIMDCQPFFPCQGFRRILVLSGTDLDKYSVNFRNGKQGSIFKSIDGAKFCIMGLIKDYCFDTMEKAAEDECASIAKLQP